VRASRYILVGNRGFDYPKTLAHYSPNTHTDYSHSRTAGSGNPIASVG